MFVDICIIGWFWVSCSIRVGNLPPLILEYAKWSFHQLIYHIKHSIIDIVRIEFSPLVQTSASKGHYWPKETTDKGPTRVDAERPEHYENVSIKNYHMTVVELVVYCSYFTWSNKPENYFYNASMDSCSSIRIVFFFLHTLFQTILYLPAIGSR